MGEFDEYNTKQKDRMLNIQKERNEILKEIADSLVKLRDIFINQI